MAATITRERLQLFEACLDDGWSFSQIRQTYGATWQTLNRHFPGRGMSRTEGARLGASARRAYQRVVTNK